MKLCNAYEFVISCRKNEVRVLEKEIVESWEFDKLVGYPFNLPVLPPGDLEYAKLLRYNYLPKAKKSLSRIPTVSLQQFIRFVKLKFVPRK